MITNASALLDSGLFPRGVSYGPKLCSPFGEQKAQLCKLRRGLVEECRNISTIMFPFRAAACLACGSKFLCGTVERPHLALNLSSLHMILGFLGHLPGDALRDQFIRELHVTLRQ
jgi:hypothetical protein